MRLAVPGFVIPAGKAICFFQPRTVFVTGGFLGLVHIHDHRSEEGRLGASQVIGAVGIEDCAVMRDFEEEIFYHPTRQVDSAVAQQSDDDEITIPAVHFIESAAGHYVTIFEVKQSMRLDVSDINFSGTANRDGQMFDVNFAVCLQLLYGWRDCQFSRQIEHGRRGQLGICHRVAARHGTGEHIPAAGYVTTDWRQARVGRDRTALRNGL